MKKTLFDRFFRTLRQRSCPIVGRLEPDLQLLRLNMGALLVQNQRILGKLENIQDAEFRVFSQWGDDGIIQYLIQCLNICTDRFVEFGVSDYREANTRFLLLHNNWSGLVIDGSPMNIAHIESDDLYWRHDLTARAAFLTMDNINKTIEDAGYTGEIGLLHIDVDGNDYWLWQALNVISPIIAIIEYNSLFGPDRAITIPYDSNFERIKAHPSGLYAGASLRALIDLSEAKGYAFVGSNSAGNNAYFVRKDHLGNLKVLKSKDGFVECKFREHRNELGRLTYLPGQKAIKGIHGMKVFNTHTNEIEDF